MSARFPIRCRLALLLAFLGLFALSSFSSAHAQATFGRGKWRISVSFSGSYSVMPSGPLQVLVTPPTGGNLSAVTNSPPSSDTGAITGSYVSALSVGLPIPGGTNAPARGGPEANGPTAMQSRAADLTMTNAQMIFTLTWLPQSGSLVIDPPPHYVWIVYRGAASAQTTAFVGSTGEIAAAGASGGCDTQSNSSSIYWDQATADTVYHTSPMNFANFQEELLIVNPATGTAQKNFSMSSSLHAEVTEIPIDLTLATASVTCRVDFCLAGMDLSRFGQQLPGLLATAPSGAPAPGPSLEKRDSSTDPTYTRWLPLAFAPILNSQPFRVQSGALPRPWGNADCMYSLTLRQEPDPGNNDLFGQSLSYRPTPGSGGTFNGALGPFTTLPGAFLTRYALADAGGDRLLYTSNFAPYPGIYSTLTPSGTTFVLSNAGPPGAIRRKGHYTYTFQKVSTDPAPLEARLVSIQDDLGNQQTLYWGSAPLLSVLDSSSGRWLFFASDANGYIGSVDAPALSGTIPATHTVTTFDANGHLTAIRVYAGGSSTLLHQDSWTYGGPNGDSVVSSVQALTQAAFTYTSDTLARDPFGLAVPRLATATYGSASDTRSSDNGQSIAGTYTYTYGPTLFGYNNFHPDMLKVSVSDPRGFTTGFTSILAYETSGPITGQVVNGLAFTGAPAGSNVIRVSATPDALTPTQVTIWDQHYVPNVTSPWDMFYDAFGNLTQLRDPLSRSWSWGYSADGKRLTGITDPTNRSWGFGYGENGNPLSRLTSMTDPGGNVRVRLTYNAFEQPVTATVPSAVSASGADEITTYTYDPVKGDLTRITGPTGDAATINAYTALGDPLSLSVFPDTGNPATSTTPLTAGLQLNAAQQMTGFTLANGVTATLTRSSDLLTQLRTNAPAASGGATLARQNFDYDSRSRLYRMSDLVGTVAQFRYDKSSNLTKILDGRGNTTRMTYGPNNELLSVIWPNNAIASYLYSAGGRVTQRTDERGIVSNYLYDAAGRLTDIQFPAYPAQNVHYTYDEAGRLLSVTDATGSRQYHYDPVLKRLSSVVTTLTGLPLGQNTYTVSYTYTGNGQVSTMSTPVGTTSYLYDENGALARLTDPFGHVTQWFSDHVGRLLSQTTTTNTGTVFSTTYSWGVSGQANDTSTAPVYLRQIQQTLNGQPFWSYTLTHSFLGQLLRQQGTGPNGRSSDTLFTYDTRGRLTSEQQFFQVTPQTLYTKTGAYSYDLANNLMGGAGGWTYNSSNQVTSAPAVGGLPGATGLTYDAAGHLTTLNGRTLTYDAWGNLSSVSNTPVGQVSYTYDAGGRRVSRTAGGQTTYFLYAGDLLLAVMDSLGSLLGSYCWGATGLISDREGSQSRFYASDGLGNTRALLAADGSVLAQTAQSALGDWQVSAGGGATTPYGWQGTSGTYQDSATGLMSASSGGRAYQPNLGQFVSPVAAGMSGGAPYSYGGGDPVNDDPLEGVDEDGRPLPYQSVRSGLHDGAGQAAALLNTLADFNPLCQTFAIVQGSDARGCQLSPWERLFRLAMLLGPHVRLPRIPNTEAYEVGAYNALRARGRGTGLQMHHLPQAHLAEQVIPGYDKERGLAIALPTDMHQTLPRSSRLQGDFSDRTASEVRALISQQLRDLVQAGVPRENLRHLGRRMRELYPGLYMR